MVLASFKDLCFDASDADALAEFWASALRRKPAEEQRDDGVRMLEAAGPDDIPVWFTPVPEAPAPAKTRVHLDLRLAEPDPTPLIGAGAQLVRAPGEDPWWVLVDPEGNEFCAFPPHAEQNEVIGQNEGPEPGEVGPFELVVDCRDALAQATWWAGIVGGKVERAGDAAVITGAAGFPWESWIFDPVPEPKTVKNRVHWDLALPGKDPNALVAVGATVFRSPDDDIRWWILTDPEGNEFCAFPNGDFPEQG